MPHDKETFSFHAPSYWLKKLTRSIMLSHEPSGSVSGGVGSPMTCVSFTTEYDGLHIESESVSSKMHVVIPENYQGDIRYNGECDFMVPVKNFVGAIDQACSSDDSCIITLDGNILGVSTQSGDVDFSVDTISETQNKPQAPYNFPDNEPVSRVNGQEFFNSHKIGSVMVKKQDKDISTGQDPMSGCIMIMKKNSIGFYSLFTSASSSMISSEIISGEVPDDGCFILSQPTTTSQIFSIFNGPNDSIDVCFDGKNSRIHMQSGLFHLSFSSLNTHKNINHQPKINQLMNMVKTKGSHVVDITLSKKELSNSLSRMHSVAPHDLKFIAKVARSTMSISSESTVVSGKNIFHQNIVAQSHWTEDYSDPQAQTVDFVADYATVKSVISNTPTDIPFEISLYKKPDDSPWLMIVKNSSNDELENNCFMISIGVV